MNNQPDINPLFSAGRPLLTQLATRNTASASYETPNVERFNRKSQIANRKSGQAFSLIELLVVIAIIAVIAAILLPVGNLIAQRSRLQTARAEMNVLDLAIKNYHDKYGFYPPSNVNSNLTYALTNQLYYELIGTTLATNNGNLAFATLDYSSTLDTNHIFEYFGTVGFMNSTRGAGEDILKAQTFLPSLKPGQIATNLDGVYVITTAAASDGIYQPMKGYSTLSGRTANPWRYLYPGVNNPNSFDLWVEVFVGGKTNLICNWKDTPQINSSLP